VDQTVGDTLIRESSGTVGIGGASLGTAELLEVAAAFAPALHGHAVVAVWASPTMATLAAILGAAMEGVVAVPLAPDAGAVERTHVLRDSGASAVVGAPPQADVALPRLEVAMETRRAVASLVPVTDDVSLILYTSGTTGRPKGVPITRRALAGNLDALAECWAWTSDDTVVHALPLFHVHGLVIGVLGTLRRGGSLVHATGAQATDLAGAVARSSSPLVFGVPTHYVRLLREPSAAPLLRKARLLVSGSAALPRVVSDGLLDACGHRPLERYGSTESLICTAARVDRPHRVGYVGPPVPGAEVRLVTAAGDELPWNDVDSGDVEVRGPSLFAGYLNNPEATAAAFRGGWYRTGDVGAMTEDGTLRLLGRASSDVLKCGGFKISAIEIESVLLSHPAVVEAAVVGVADADLGERPVAFVIATGVSGRELIDFVATELSVHKRPRDVVFVSDLPHNAMGKVQKDLLR
jgi:fatty acid CoA ligase FadD36